MADGPDQLDRSRSGNSVNGLDSIVCGSVWVSGMHLGQKKGGQIKMIIIINAFASLIVWLIISMQKNKTNTYENEHPIEDNAIA